jgi:hypothetical protein
MQAENALTILQRSQLAEKDGNRELTDDEQADQPVSNLKERRVSPPRTVD